MKLKDLMVDTKSVWVPFDGIEGFEVELNYIPRTEMSNIVKSCQKSEFSRSSRSVEKTLDEDKFLNKFVDRAIKNWKGLTPRKLEKLVPVDYNEDNADVEVPFDQESAVALVKQSSFFDDWLNDRISDIDSFRREGS